METPLSAWFDEDGMETKRHINSVNCLADRIMGLAGSADLKR
jgi:hypothetical protein